jgi:hypothetical protein
VGLWHWLVVISGARDEAGGWYGLWSGFGGALPDVMIVAAITGWWVHHTCHASPRCLRWGKYLAAAGTFRLCRHHHPDMAGQKPHAELIHRLHREQQEGPQ